MDEADWRPGDLVLKRSYSRLSPALFIELLQKRVSTLGDEHCHFTHVALFDGALIWDLSPRGRRDSSGRLDVRSAERGAYLATNADFARVRFDVGFSAARMEASLQAMSGDRYMQTFWRHVPKIVRSQVTKMPIAARIKRFSQRWNLTEEKSNELVRDRIEYATICSDWVMRVLQNSIPRNSRAQLIDPMHNWEGLVLPCHVSASADERLPAGAPFASSH